MTTLLWQTPVLTEITPRALTDDEARVDIAAKLEAMHAAWATSSGVERDRQLTSALIMCGPFRPLPDWLYQALLDQQMARLQEHDNWLLTGKHEPSKGLEKPDPDWLRWLTLTDVRREGFKGKKALEEASKRLKGTLAEGVGSTIRHAFVRVTGIIKRGAKK